VKTLTHNNGTVVLTPANPAEREIEIKPGDDFGILGVVCGVFRPFVAMEQMRVAESQKNN
jgi:SOS-response transcriptional repressor LexA